MHLCVLCFFLTTMHLCLTTMHLCVFFPHHYALLCLFLTTTHLCVFFVTIPVLFRAVLFVFVLSNSSRSTSVMLTCQTLLNSCLTHQTPLEFISLWSHTPQLSAQPLNSCLTRQTPLTVVPHPPTICPTPQSVFDSSSTSHCGPTPLNCTINCELFVEPASNSEFKHPHSAALHQPQL